MTVIVHIVPHATDKGLSPLIAAQILSTIGISSIAGRLIIGIIADRFGGTLSLVFCYTALITSFAIIYLFEAKWILFVFAMFYRGFTDAACISKNVVLPLVLHGFGNPRHRPWFSTRKYHALGDIHYVHVHPSTNSVQTLCKQELDPRLGFFAPTFSQLKTRKTSFLL